MNEVVLVAIIVSIAPTVAAIAALITIVRTRRVAVAKLEHIETLTNSTLTAANKRIEELESIVSRLLAGDA